MSSRLSRRIARRRSPTTALSTRKQLSVAWMQRWQRRSRTVCHTQDTRSLHTHKQTEKDMFGLKMTSTKQVSVLRRHKLHICLITDSPERFAATSPNRKQHPLHRTSPHQGWLISEPGGEKPAWLCLFLSNEWLSHEQSQQELQSRQRKSVQDKTTMNFIMYKIIK